MLTAHNRIFTILRNFFAELGMITLILIQKLKDGLRNTHGNKPICNYSAGLLQGFQSVAVHVLVFEHSNRTLDYAVLLQAARGGIPATDHGFRPVSGFGAVPDQTGV